LENERIRRAWEHAMSIAVDLFRILIFFQKKIASIEAIFKKVHFELVAMHVDLFELVDVDVDAVMFHRIRVSNLSVRYLSRLIVAFYR